MRAKVLDGAVATDATRELVQDMLAIIDVFAGRLCGRRSQFFRRKIRGATTGLVSDPAKDPHSVLRPGLLEPLTYSTMRYTVQLLCHAGGVVMSRLR